MYVLWNHFQFYFVMFKSYLGPKILNNMILKEKLLMESFSVAWVTVRWFEARLCHSLQAGRSGTRDRRDRDKLALICTQTQPKLSHHTRCHKLSQIHFWTCDVLWSPLFIGRSDEILRSDVIQIQVWFQLQSEHGPRICISSASIIGARNKVNNKVKKRSSMNSSLSIIRWLTSCDVMTFFLTRPTGKVRSRWMALLLVSLMEDYSSKCGFHSTVFTQFHTLPISTGIVFFLATREKLPAIV